MNIPFFHTYINSKAINSVTSVIKSTYLSEGKIVSNFEDRLHNKLGFTNPIALNSGTSALHLAMLASGIKEGDEVICPAQTFVASALAILYVKATPVFADIQYKTGNIDPASIEKKITKKTKAILVVHWGGYPCDMDEIQAIAKKNKIIVIEDAAHAPGAVYKGKPIGSISDFTCFSFQAIKHITTGDGGAICCKKKQHYQKILAQRWFGIDRKKSSASLLGERKYNITEIGYKYHMNDYSAALGLANIETFKQRLANRNRFASLYRETLSNINGIRLFENSSDRKSAYWLFGIHVEKRNHFIRAMNDKGIAVSVVHQRIDRNNIFGGIRKDLINQERFDKTQLHLPMHDALDEEKISYIAGAIKKGW